MDAGVKAWLQGKLMSAAVIKLIYRLQCKKDFALGGEGGFWWIRGRDESVSLNYTQAGEISSQLNNTIKRFPPEEKVIKI